VAYCATCDGPLFSNKIVAVVGGGNSALDAAFQMTKFASKVYLINIVAELTGDPLLGDKISASGKAEILNNTKVIGIFGDKFVKGIKIETSGNIRELEVQGVFVEIGLIPKADFIDFVDKNEKGEIIITCDAYTSFPGVFAAGDVTSVPEKQIIIAAGDGAKAALAAFKYLSTR